MTNDITISDVYLQEIIAITGFPILSFEDNAFELTKEQFKALIIRKTMRTYFKWFPKKTYEQFSVSGNFEIDFPNNNVFNAVDVRTNNVTNSTTRRTANALVNSRNYSSGSTFGGNVYGTGNNYGMTSALIIHDSTIDSIQSRYKNERLVVDTYQRKIIGFVNQDSKLNVTWAEFDTNFDLIPMSRLDEVIKLSQAHWLRYLGMLRGQQTGGLPQEWDVDSFKDMADDFEDEVMTTWKQFTKVSIVRG